MAHSSSTFQGAECRHQTLLLPQSPLLAKLALAGYELLQLRTKVESRFPKGAIHLSWSSPFPSHGASGE